MNESSWAACRSYRFWTHASDRRCRVCRTNDRILTFSGIADPHLEVAAILKKLDGDKVLLVPSVRGYDTPVIGQPVELQGKLRWPPSGIDFNGIRSLVQRAIGAPLAPELGCRCAGSGSDRGG